MTTGTVLWSPPADVLETSRMGRFLTWVRDERGVDVRDYPGLWEWSVTDLAGFWGAVWDHFDVIAHDPPSGVLDEVTMPGARWFPGAALNYAENVLRMPGLADDDVVVHAYSQTREPVTLTARQLRDQVRRAAAGLRRLGVGPGDRVAAYAPNIPETFVLFLATAGLGAVFSSCAPEFGSRSVIDRWSQIGPKVLVAVDGYRYGTKEIDRRAEVAEIHAALPSVESLITIPYLGQDGNWDTLDGPDPLTFAAVPFDHPLYVLYSSGTTGLPKPIVHGHGGILLEHLKMLALHHDLGPGDRFLWFTTTGWMMWNFLVSGPAVGAAIVLYDGNPGHPDLGALWRLAADAGVTYFGTSAPFILASRKAGVQPPPNVIRGVGSTGAPLPPEGYRWIYDVLGPKPQLQSLSGGTDVCTGFVGGTPLLPVIEGVISCRALGARVEAYDPRGEPVHGRLGELVITAPMPSMPVGFWNDPDGQRYFASYFDVFPGVWRHGDWITIGDDGTCVITGRSDATLNRGGVRLGTAEFYSVVEGLPGIADSLVVHLDDRDQLLLFVVPAEGHTLDDELRGRIGATLRAALSPRHVPDKIFPVRAVPRTLSGKKLEVPVKRILTGTPPGEAVALGALSNPESLRAFESVIPAL
ncbi:acetoacetate--CoA ligase [Actinoplanes sp. NPDC051494]|uniref:acetoacetate--CoA ligase n=1 Tax=Actinoplanes sp. NPDC051494 TaxID=3363907 RepID=UPI0037B2E573